MSHNSKSSSVATAGFKWIDILEKEFDRSFLELDEVIRAVADDYEAPEMYESNRRHLNSLGSCFAQVVHKATAIFQTNAKYDAKLLHLREELSELAATTEKIESEKQFLSCRLQATLLDNHTLKRALEKNHLPDPTVPTGGDSSASSSRRFRSGKSSSIHNDSGGTDQEHHPAEAEIRRRLEDEMAVIRRVDWDAKKLEEKCRRLIGENDSLRRTQAELESELVGARLDAKYLDKELAGRIQQIQILLAGGGTSRDRKQKVWSQIEAEMHLQRSKTISTMCYSKQKVRENARKKRNHDASPSTCSEDDTCGATTNSDDQDSRKSSLDHGGSGLVRIKQVHIHKSDVEELGMAILGGHEHGLPVTISEVFPDTAVGRCSKIRAGDVIISVNGDSFAGLGHSEAVRYLSALRGAIRIELEERVDPEVDGVCDMDARYYALFEEAEAHEDEDAAEYQEEKHDRRNQENTSSHQGKTSFSATRKKSSNSLNSNNCGSTRDDDLPAVHSSPTKREEEPKWNV